MKHLGLFIIAFITTVNVRAADTLCGNVEKRVITPICEPAELCAQYFRIAHFLVGSTNEIELQTQDWNTLMQITDSEGKAVCVEGQPSSDPAFFEVTAVTPTPLN